MLLLDTDFVATFNTLTKTGQAFVFLIDFEGQKPVICPVTAAASQDFYFQTPITTNFHLKQVEQTPIEIEFKPIDKTKYKAAFDTVQSHLHRGDTYLLNLTKATPVQISVPLLTVFSVAEAPYKVYFKDEFVCFSPETFIKTAGNSIKTFPMKGTMRADLPDADKLLLSSEKETNEHHTIVDLLRNDLSMVAKNVQVNRFKYLEEIRTNHINIWQMSSEIEGTLPKGWRQEAAKIFQKLLPAGSISGAPKKKTIEIIQSVEGASRGYYTGVFGYFDGQDFDTAVMIRYIEKTSKGYFYRSGGGITAMSRLEDEYNEIIEKIYVPVS